MSCNGTRIIKVQKLSIASNKHNKPIITLKNHVQNVMLGTCRANSQSICLIKHDILGTMIKKQQKIHLLNMVLINHFVGQTKHVLKALSTRVNTQH